MAELTVQTIYDWLNALAPFDTAEDFDNAGLLIGDPAAVVHTVLFGLDATPELAAQAVAMGAELVITHHPLIFSPLRRIDYTSPQGQAIATLVSHRLNLLSAHTNWDKAVGGVSDALAEAIGLCGSQAVDSYIRLGRLPEPMTADGLAQLVAQRLNNPPRTFGCATGLISAVAVAGGAYGEGAAIAHAAGAQAYITGEVKHHELLDACGRGLVICDAGHYATEAPGIRALYQRFLAQAAEAGWSVTAQLYDTAPIRGARP